MKKVGAVAAVVSILSVTSSAFAGDKAMAEELFRKAQSAMQKAGATKQEVHQACQWFKESLDQDSTLNTQVALAACYEKEGKNRSAWGLYSDAASQAGPAAAYAKDRADALYKQGFLHLRIELPNAPDGTRVVLDDNSIGAGALNTELAADPGDHLLKVTAPGKKDVEKRFELTKESSPLKVPVVFEDAPVEKPPVGGGGPPVIVQQEQPSSPVRTLGYIVGGVGIAAIVAGGVTFGIALKFDADSKTLASRSDIPGAQQANNQAKAAQGGAIGLLVGGGVLFVTGVVLFFVGAPKAPEKVETKATWHVVPGLGGASVVGTF